MHALGIPTTRALAAVSTGEPVYRDRQLPGAVLTRAASSHIRVGTFQYFAARGDLEAVERLSDYVIDRHFPDARDAERPRLALLQAVVERQALLIARWMQVGFIHGVMNTDNTALSGETIDFGPCAFMDSYDPATAFSAIDEFGRYAYGNQPTIAQWNLARFAETLLPLVDPNPERTVELANEAVSAFTSRYQEHWLAGMREKLGLSSKKKRRSRPRPRFAPSGGEDTKVHGLSGLHEQTTNTSSKSVRLWPENLIFQPMRLHFGANHKISGPQKDALYQYV